MNADREFDQESSSQQSGSKTQLVADKKMLGSKRSRTASILRASTTKIPDQTLLPSSQSLGDEEDGAQQPHDDDVVVVVLAKPEKTILRTVVSRKSGTKSSYLSAFYNVQGFTLETTYKVVGKKINQKGVTVDKFVRNGLQVWRNEFGQVVRQRTFVDGKLHGPDTVFCYPVKMMRVFGAEPAEFVQVYLDRQEVCTRKFVDGLLQGLQTRNEFNSVVDKETNNAYFVAGTTRIETNFRDGLKHGNEKRIRISDGKVLYSANFAMGQKDGLVEHFTLSKRISAWFWQNGTRMHGQTFYRNTTQIKFQVAQSSGGVSVFTKFDKNNKVVLQTRYQSGKKDGEQILLVEGQPQTWTWKAGERIDPPSNARSKTKRSKTDDDDDDATQTN